MIKAEYPVLYGAGYFFAGVRTVRNFFEKPLDKSGSAMYNISNIKMR